MDSIDAAELALSLPEVDPERPSPARIYDFWLGGSQNFEADREAGRRAAQAMPNLPVSAQANRVFLRHVIEDLVTERGITQFLDLGSGVPTAGNVHEAAQAVDPGATVVYIDIDPVAIAHARSLLADNPSAHAALADVRDPGVVLEHPVVRDSIDWTKPVAVLLFAVLHFIPDDDQAERIVRAFTEPCAPGSYLALSHGAPDHAALEAQQNAARDYAARTGVPFTPRTAEQITPWLSGLDIQPPGVEDIRVWVPSLNVSHTGMAPCLGVLARKPVAG
ncbi:SAM-dependent methyltransferase [Catenulispora sp. NL8]|uniref:SAM-dependent methyltransferase n=1 Tax=Catenulispora pinistramenti TaxID=2705254 RepID=A0ABS5L0S1_9ACTN|nr:SAM-dependent methyltransferase [Catenulispora pinistramenti]MBS2551932.1 SAM-dependent methyltransferase [Catenulispora pinistramenti]